MQVTPLHRKFGKYSPGDVFSLPDKTAKILIKLKKIEPAAYLTRDMRAARPQVPAVIVDVPVDVTDTKVVEHVDQKVADDGAEDAPYGYKADGTPRKRPGRPAADN